MVKHGLIYLLAKLFAGIIGFISIVLYTRILVPDEYGRYALILVYVNLINSLLYQWFRLGLIRYIPKFQKKDSMYNRLLSTVIICYIACCFITLLVGVFLVTLGFQSILQVSIILVFLWTTAWFELSQAIQRSKLKPVRFGIMTGMKSLTSLLFGGIALYLGYGEIGLLIGISFGTLITNLVFIKEWNTKSKLSFDRSIILELMKYGLPLIISGGMAYIMQSIDRVMIGTLMGESAAGIYSVTFDFALQTIGMLMMIVNLSALPLVIRKLESEGYISAQEQLIQNYQLLLAISLPAVLGLTVLSSNITSVVFGSDFKEQATMILPIISFAMLFQGLKAYYTDNSYQLGRTTYKQAFPVITGIIMNVLLNLFLIPKLGLLGASLSSLIAYCSSFLTNWFVAKKIFYLPFPVVETLKIVVASSVMASVLVLLQNQTGLLSLIFQVSVGIIVYGVTFILLNIMKLRTILLRKVLSDKEKKMVKSNN